MPDATDAGYRYDPSASLSTSNEREALQTQQGCSLIPIQTRCVNAALHLKLLDRNQIGNFKLLKIGKVVASCSPETPIQFATGTATHSQGNSGTNRPSKVPRVAASQSTSTSAKLSNLSRLLPHTDPDTPCQHSALIENSSTGTKSILSNCYNSKGGREMFTRAVPSQRLLLARSQSPTYLAITFKTQQLHCSAANQLATPIQLYPAALTTEFEHRQSEPRHHSNCPQSAANQLDDTTRTRPPSSLTTEFTMHAQESRT